MAWPAEAQARLSEKAGTVGGQLGQEAHLARHVRREHRCDHLAEHDFDRPRGHRARCVRSSSWVTRRASWTAVTSLKTVPLLGEGGPEAGDDDRDGGSLACSIRYTVRDRGCALLPRTAARAYDCFWATTLATARILLPPAARTPRGRAGPRAARPARLSSPGASRCSSPRRAPAQGALPVEVGFHEEQAARGHRGLDVVYPPPVEIIEHQHDIELARARATRPSRSTDCGSRPRRPSRAAASRAGLELGLVVVERRSPCAPHCAALSACRPSPQARSSTRQPRAEEIVMPDAATCWAAGGRGRAAGAPRVRSGIGPRLNGSGSSRRSAGHRGRHHRRGHRPRRRHARPRGRSWWTSRTSARAPAPAPAA